MQKVEFADLDEMFKNSVVRLIKNLSDIYDVSTGVVVQKLSEMKYDEILKELDGIQPGSICQYSKEQGVTFLVTKVYTISPSSEVLFDGVYANGFTINGGHIDLIEVVNNNFAGKMCLELLLSPKTTWANKENKQDARHNN